MFLVNNSKLITFPSPTDLHVHFRQHDVNGLDILSEVAPFHRHFGTVVAMPNTTPPITVLPTLGWSPENYRNIVVNAIGSGSTGVIVPIYLTDATTHGDINFAHVKYSNKVAKLYPKGDGGTTNSGNGVTLSKIEELYPCFKTMENLGIVLSVHGEDPDEREPINAILNFLKILGPICTKFPRLKVVIEHISTQSEIDFIKWHPNIYGGITLHHMDFSLGDTQSDGGNHLKCLPPLKGASDKLAIMEAAMSGNPKFFFGSDSAPHAKEFKNGSFEEAHNGCFTAPVLLERLATIFDRFSCLHMLPGFVSYFGAQFYGFNVSRRLITLRMKTKEQMDRERAERPTYSTSNVTCPYDLFLEKQITWEIVEG